MITARFKVTISTKIPFPPDKRLPCVLVSMPYEVIIVQARRSTEAEGWVRAIDFRILSDAKV